MSRSGQPFIPLEKPKSTHPPAAMLKQAGASTVLRDQFTITTWLSLGAILQGTVFLVVGRIALLPAVAVLLYRAFDTYAQLVGWKHNTYMDDIIMKKFASQFPKEDGSFGSVPCEDDVVVFLIGARSNHPLGLLAPGFKQLGDYFVQMVRDLDQTGRDQFGFLGATSWLNSSDRTTGNENMTVCYFRSVEGLHAFAHSDFHRKGWDWWNRTVKDLPHLSIWHETYHVPKGHWETIYVNSHLSGINSTSFKIFDQESGDEKWQSPVVDASKGLLKTSAGRMSRSKADEHDQYGTDPYEKY